MKLYLAALVSLLLSLGVLLFLLTHHQFKQMKARGDLMLCLKEVKGELHDFIILTERMNWAIKHIDKAKYLVFIPGLQAVAANAEKTKKYIQKYQDFTLTQYLLKLTKLKRRCHMSPSSFMTPYQITVSGFRRHFDGTTQWRNEQWSLQILGQVELAQIQIKDKKSAQQKPQVTYSYSIKKVNALSVLPSFWASSLLPWASTSL